jgi:hypothetical protein
MSVVRDHARSVLWQRLFGEPAADGVIHRSRAEDPRGFLALAGHPAPDPDLWLWRPGDEPVPALADPQAYDLSDDHDLDLRQIHRSPAEAESAAADDGGTAAHRAYCRASADVIMRGGTASGVVYPPALCEIARHFRLRSLGGASAGAIAAAAGAAAELGRMRRDLGRDEARRHGGAAAAAAGTAPGPVPPAREGRFRQGYPGLADLTAWLAELDPARAPDPERDGAPRFRVAGLFQPAPGTRPAFRVVFAATQASLGRAAALVPFAAGPVSGLVAAVVVVLSVPALLVASPDELPGGPLGIGLAAALLGTLSVLAVGTVLSSTGGRRPVAAGSLGAGLLGAVVVTLALVAADLGARQITAAWISAVGTWLVAALLVVTVQVVPLARVFLGFRDRRYGLIAGSDPAPRHGWSRRLDDVAGLPAGTPVVDWLADVFDDLAGQPDGEILRFGHLWLGDDFVPPERRASAADGRRTDLEAALTAPARRLVNLELMTSELTQGLAYRLPLSRQESLWYRPEDLGGAAAAAPTGHVFGERVMAALAAGTPGAAREAVVEGETQGGGRIRLRPLPDPWDLPVVVAVRLSMALPVAFQAVPVYREVRSPAPVDEFGREIGGAGDAVLDGAGTRGAAVDLVVERLWFSDGGLTSNFPVHFFDTPLPRWPTLGVNLGTHPQAAAEADDAPRIPPDADVALPQDGAELVPRARHVGRSVQAFFGTLFATSRNWRDTEVALRPAYAGRIAEVRLGAGEGDLSIAMTPDVVASIALRGIIAGARLRRRWAHDPIWRRHQWLRMHGAEAGIRDLLDVARRNAGSPPYDAIREEPEGAVASLYAGAQMGDPTVPDPADSRLGDAPSVAASWNAVVAAAGQLGVRPVAVGRPAGDGGPESPPPGAGPDLVPG